MLRFGYSHVRNVMHTFWQDTHTHAQTHSIWTTDFQNSAPHNGELMCCERIR